MIAYFRRKKTLMRQKDELSMQLDRAREGRDELEVLVKQYRSLLKAVRRG